MRDGSEELVRNPYRMKFVLTPASPSVDATSSSALALCAGAARTDGSPRGVRSL